MTTPAHRCLRGRQCSNRESTSDQPAQGAVTEAPDALCRTCERHAGRAVADLPELYVQLEMIIDQQTASGEHVSGTREQPIPPRLDVLTLQADIDATVTLWAAPLARRCRVVWDIHALGQLRAGPRVSRAAHMLASQMDALLRLPATDVRAWVPGHGLLDTRLRGVDGALALLALAQRGRHLVTGGTGHVHLPVPCPACEGPLVRANGSDQVDCRSCGQYWPESDYRRLCLVLADDYRDVERAGRRRRPAA